MITCSLDCFNCTKPDCDVDFIDHNSLNCKKWYAKNREKKLAYQRAYNKRKRSAPAPVKIPTPEPVTELMSFRELAERIS